MRLLARFAYILTLGEVDLMPVARDPKPVATHWERPAESLPLVSTMF